MPSWSTLSAFAAATIVLLLIPGPAVLYAQPQHRRRRRVGLQPRWPAWSSVI
ncbi:MAG: hypothetical protein R2755_19495 [Acidimicrobiales bacterium]